MSFIRSQRTFTINSASRESGTNEAFNYRVDIPKGENYDRVAVLDASIPKSYYMVQAGSNTFTLQETSGAHTVTIAAGNYDVYSFASTLQTALNQASGSGWTYTVSLPATATAADTGKYSYTCAGGSGAQPSFVLTTNLYEQLGFDVNSTNTFVANALTSTNVCKFQAEDNLILHSDCVGEGKDDTLQHILAGNAPSFGIISYQCTDVQANSRTLNGRDGNVFRFSLTDEFGRVMNLNGQNFVFTIVVYKRETALEKLSRALEIYAQSIIKQK